MGLVPYERGPRELTSYLMVKTTTKLQVLHFSTSNLYKAKIIKTVWYWYKARHVDEWSIIESPETHTSLVNWFFIRGKMDGKWLLTDVGFLLGVMILVVVAHILEATDFCSINGWILWYVNLISIKSFFKKKIRDCYRQLHGNKFYNLNKMKYSFICFTFSLLTRFFFVSIIVFSYLLTNVIIFIYECYAFLYINAVPSYFP